MLAQASEVPNTTEARSLLGTPPPRLGSPPVTGPGEESALAVVMVSHFGRLSWAETDELEDLWDFLRDSGLVPALDDLGSAELYRWSRPAFAAGAVDVKRPPTPTVIECERSPLRSSSDATFQAHIRALSC